MARKVTLTPPLSKPSLELNVAPDDAKSRLQDRIEKGLELKKLQVLSCQEFETVRNEYYKWDSYNSELLKRLFTSDELEKEYSFWGVVVVPTREQMLEEKLEDLYNDIDKKNHRLDSIIERLELIPLISTIAQRSASSATTRSKKVFVVHGHNEIAKTNLEVFLHENGLEPVVLHRQADEGLTIIEKFEKHSDVGYAFILLTPDEVAYLVTEDSKPDNERNKEFRARPNVIFEFGYFVGKLGRSRVCCLYTGDVTLPSDVSGMIYKKYTKNIDEVAYSIIKDLKASGYVIA